MIPDIDVVIVSHNTRRDLERCLESIERAESRAVRRVVVVDNASTDGSPGAVRERWPNADLVPLDRNVGFGPANNIGLRRGQSPLVLLLNSDTIVPPGAIDVLAERLMSAGAVAAGPRLVDADGRPEVSFGPMLSPSGELRQLVRQRLARSDRRLARLVIARLTGRERRVDWLTGACLLVRRDAAVAAGLFDERFFLYEEDVDFCAALRARGGWLLFTPRAEITHLRGQSSPSTAAARAHYDRSHLLFYRKHRPGWAPLLALWLRVRGRL